MYLLKRYRSIILVAFVGAVLVSGGAFCKAKFLTTEEDFEKYEREVDAYNTDLNLLEIYQDKLDEAKASLNEKPLISVNNYDLPVSTITLCVEGTYAELLNNSTTYDPGDSIVNNIVLNIQKVTDWESLADKYDVNKKYVKDLIGIFPDYNSNVVVVNAYGTNIEEAEGMLNDIIANVDNNLNEILDSYRGYYVKKRNNRTYIDTTWVNNIEENIQNDINDYIVLINDLSNKYKDEPKAPDYFSVLRGIKYAIIGGVAGGVIMAGIYCVLYLLSNRLREEDELHTYFGFVSLGVFSLDLSKVKGNAFDKFLLKKQYGISNNENIYGRIAENINLLSEKGDKILVIGTIDSAMIENLCVKLCSMVKNAEIIYGGNINVDNEALSKLGNADSVIFVEKRNISKMNDIDKEVDIVNNCKKKVLGYIQY